MSSDDVHSFVSRQAGAAHQRARPARWRPLRYWRECRWPWNLRCDCWWPRFVAGTHRSSSSVQQSWRLAPLQFLYGAATRRASCRIRSTLLAFPLTEFSVKLAPLTSHAFLLLRDHDRPPRMTGRYHVAPARMLEQHSAAPSRAAHTDLWMTDQQANCSTARKPSTRARPDKYPSVTTTTLTAWQKPTAGLMPDHAKLPSRRVETTLRSMQRYLYELSTQLGAARVSASRMVRR